MNTCTQHLRRYSSAYLKGAALLLAQLAAGYATAIDSITPAQWQAMDTLHRSGFFAGLVSSGALLVAAFLSQAIGEAKAKDSGAVNTTQKEPTP